LAVSMSMGGKRFWTMMSVSLMCRSSDCVSDPGFRVQGPGFWVLGAGFRVEV